MRCVAGAQWAGGVPTCDCFHTYGLAPEGQEESDAAASREVAGAAEGSVSRVKLFFTVNPFVPCTCCPECMNDLSKPCKEKRRR